MGIYRWGFIDRKNYRVQEPSNATIQNCMYNGWPHSACITGTACFSFIMLVKLIFFGSFNDGEMSRFSREKRSDPVRSVDGHGVFSDSAFPVANDIISRIITPLKDGDTEMCH